MITPKEVNRNILTNYSTGLSEKLSAGEIHPVEVIKAVNTQLKNSSLSEDEQDYLSQIKRQLVFREFARSAIEQQDYKVLPGAKGEDSQEFIDLKNGDTGIPLIDAAVKELEATGKPHNRARLLLARYGIRNLNIDPEVIAKWLGDRFKDYDPVLTTFNVTSASSGATFAEPYFRKSNPLTASKRLDPKGEYRDKWLPEDYMPKDKEQALEEINKGHDQWIKRWKSSKPTSSLDRRKLYPTRDPVKGIYFVKDQLPANSSFSHFYKKFKEEEDNLLKRAYIKRKIREGDPYLPKDPRSKKISRRTLNE